MREEKGTEQGRVESKQMFFLGFAFDTASDEGSARPHTIALYKRSRSAVGDMRGKTDKVSVQGDKQGKHEKLSKAMVKD